MLENAHSKNDYTSLFHPNAVFPVSSQSYNPTDSDSAVNSQIDGILQRIRPPLLEVVRGSRTLDTWSPRCDDNEHLDHVASLKIPRCDRHEQPLLVLHDLGHLIPSETLERNLESVFRKDENTFFVNASGSGKTRLLYEGLCRHWGLYFAARLDSSGLGSKHVGAVVANGLVFSDVVKLPHPSMPSYPSTLHHNFDFIIRRYKDVLLAQVLVFKAFLDLADPCLTDEHKQRWLYCQLQPSALLARDPFHAISHFLLKASDAYVDHHLQAVLKDIHHRLGADVPLFAVLDEAQSLGHNDSVANIPYGFPSDDSRPYMQRLLTAWRGRPGLSLIITGTCLPRDIFHDDPVEMVYGRYRWTSATGGFDAVGSNRQYILRYLPPLFLQEASGKRLLRRLGTWLRGRHRFTTSFIGQYLRHGLSQPHQLLNDYIRNATGYSPRDADDLTESEGDRFGQAWRLLRPISFWAMRDWLVRSTLHHALFRVFVDSSASHQYDAEYVRLVTEGYGRFVDHDASQVVIDEPFMLVSCALWFKNNNVDFFNIDYLRMRSEPMPHASELRCLRLAFVLSRHLERKPPLRQLFDIKGTPPSWADARAISLLLQHRTARGVVSARVYSCEKEVAGSTSSLTTVACTDAEIERWLDHANPSSPFCILRLSEECVLLFALKLHGNEHVWVALDGRQGEPLTADEVNRALARMDPTTSLEEDQLDKLRRLPKPCRRAGDPPIFFAFASGLPDLPQDTLDRAVASVDVAQLCESTGITARQALQATVRFTLSRAAEPTESSTAKRPRAIEPDAGPCTRARKRRATELGVLGSERILRQSTVQQRRRRRSRG
ncbi:uncharacterized protein SCHCODRAFT_02688161 [Schizophyllum commune H4-8]|nr:uncharacterized protein SCHCODRAFT_02688161 [Schizophyllum commune H4-8]KAI5894152.1 hypothetical protein SCHCODRAFT_02688161 [Schizophyllum commune H4-8]